MNCPREQSTIPCMFTTYKDLGRGLFALFWCRFLINFIYLYGHFVYIKSVVICLCGTPGGQKVSDSTWAGVTDGCESSCEC